MILFTLFVLMGPIGLIIGVLLAIVLTGEGAVMALAIVFAGVSQMVLLFLAATIIDTTTAVFAFYAIDKANATISGEHGALLHATVNKYGQNTGQIETAAVPPAHGSAPMGNKVDPNMNNMNNATMVNNPAGYATGAAV
jgi:hypothetical protein